MMYNTIYLKRAKESDLILKTMTIRNEYKIICKLCSYRQFCPLTI